MLWAAEMSPFIIMPVLSPGIKRMMQSNAHNEQSVMVSGSFPEFGGAGVHRSRAALVWLVCRVLRYHSAPVCESRVAVAAAEVLDKIHIKQKQMEPREAR